jgi:diguanylate cyclase (GGDEF)-like protein
MTASRLQTCVRETDTVARLGGDEFTVIVSHLSDRKPAIELAKRIIKSLGVPFDLSLPDGDLVLGYIGASIGIAFMPDDGKTVEDVLKSADAAMYAVKERGKGNYSLFGTEPVSDQSA